MIAAKVLGLISASALLTLSAAAQSAPAWESDGCAQITVSATYARCGLWFSEDYLMRGAPGTAVAMADPLVPIPLSRFVRGDTARQFAVAYEHKSRTAKLMHFAGGAVMLGESVAIMTRGVRVQDRDGHTNRVAATVMISGLGLMLASHPVRWLARRDAERAVDAHNRTLRRE